MSIDLKIRLALLAISVVAAVFLAPHVGHVQTNHLFLEGIGPGPSHQ